MVTVKQIKDLVQAHYDNNNECFNAIALQIALQQVSIEDLDTAEEIRAILEKAANDSIVGQKPVDLSDYILMYHPNKEYDELLFSQKTLDFINEIVSVYKECEQNTVLGLKTYHKRFLLNGAKENGQMETASLIAKELELPLYVVRTSKILKRSSEEVARLLRQLFEMTYTHRGVYVLEKLNKIGEKAPVEDSYFFTEDVNDKVTKKEKKEHKRNLNSLIKHMEYNRSESLIFGLTDSMHRLDPELFLLFHDSNEYWRPGKVIIEEIIKLKLGANLEDFPLNESVRKAASFTHTKIRKSCDKAIQMMILGERSYIDKRNLLKAMYQ